MALDTSDLKNLNARELLIIGLTVLFGIGYGFHEFEYAPQNKKLKTLTMEITQAQSSLGAFQQIMVNPKNVEQTKAQVINTKEKIEKLEQDIEKAKSRLRGQDTEILNDLQNEADFFGVFLKSMQTSEKFVNRSGLRLKEVSLIMEMESDYDALKNFIASLGKSTAVIDIESLETKRVEKILPKIESRLHLKVMVL
ncbi:MAG: hypothetical protein HOK41_17825 [Nitrospina sp.]|jgi:Tfp pilus assembly protein PilO|nr:hypothetical protein [Nitrospina sp.]